MIQSFVFLTVFQTFVKYATISLSDKYTKPVYHRECYEMQAFLIANSILEGRSETLRPVPESYDQTPTKEKKISTCYRCKSDKDVYITDKATINAFYSKQIIHNVIA